MAVDFNYCNAGLLQMKEKYTVYMLYVFALVSQSTQEGDVQK